MEYYSALKRKEILAHGTTWMKLEDLMLIEISQSQKEKNLCVIPQRYEVPRVINVIET